MYQVTLYAISQAQAYIKQFTLLYCSTCIKPCSVWCLFCGTNKELFGDNYIRTQKTGLQFTAIQVVDICATLIRRVELVQEY